MATKTDKKSANEFNSGNSELFPFPFFTGILHIVCNSTLIHVNV